jgi:UDP-N-acetylmuramyl pentapeptide phosphotransferase/UDP-N-acetylglucosamine-1-phosphate transferase
MRVILILGIIVIVFGAFALISQGITYTKTEKIVDIGPIEATAKRQKTIPIPRLAGVAIVAAGVILVIAGSQRR